MGQQTKIEWTDATWNPVTGCTKVSAGCKNCYAERDFHRPYPGRDFTDLRTHPERLDWPLRWRGSKQAKAEGRPSRIFVNSMSDLFHEAVPEEFIGHVFATMARAEQHVFQVLTKRPKEMFDLVGNDESRWGPFQDAALEGDAETWPLPNVWLGVSVEDQSTFDERSALLRLTPAAVRFISYEPALGPIDAGLPDDLEWLDWVIAGGESGPHARPSHPDWFRSVRDQCLEAGVPFFFKQWGEWAPISTSTGIQELPFGNYSVEPGWIGKRVFYPGFLKRGKKLSGRLLDGRHWDRFPYPKTEKEKI